ncbi:MAG: phosphatase PAP2 family protein [Saprospiraceae bacterium]|nr:phosphatase PAP2 family protein [Lewinella sp.]
MLDTLLEWDQWLFHLINYDWHNGFLDQMMPLWREKKVWIPLYILLAGFVFYRFRWKGLYFVLAAVLTIAIADPVSSQLIKKNFQRERPCRAAHLDKEVKLLVPCGGGYSFTSSHATNHFALGAFLFLTVGRLIGRWRWLFLLWAASIAFGQVYVGVHYPLDVTVGGLVGFLIGWLIYRLYSSIPSIRIPEFTDQPPPQPAV